MSYFSYCKQYKVISVFQHLSGGLVIRSHLVLIILICSLISFLSAPLWYCLFVLLPTLMGTVWPLLASDPPRGQSDPEVNVWSSHDHSRSLTLSAVKGLGCWNILFEYDNEEWGDTRCRLAQRWEFSTWSSRFRNNSWPGFLPMQIAEIKFLPEMFLNTDLEVMSQVPL